MGKRNLDLGGLTKSEQSRILEVIQRDFALRKIENNRIETLSNVVTTQSKEDDPTKCLVCGSTFIWLFNTKAQCNSCQAFFCKSKLACGYEITTASAWICAFCKVKREIHQRSLDWFYLQLKNKFRRHGGAKVLREFYKNKQTDANSPPPKPPHLTNTTRTITSEKSASTTASTDKNNEEVKEDAEQGDTLSDTEIHLKTQIEKAIAAVLLPKLEELKVAQEQSRDPNHSLRQIEELMDKFLQQASEQRSPQQNDDDLMWRYLKDHKQNVMLRIMKELTENANSQTDLNSTVSSFRDAETMTEASDSELESSPSCSGSVRSRRSQRAPLSERMRNLSPESLRGVLNSQKLPGRDHQILQGVVRKDVMLAAAEVNAVMSELLEEEDSDVECSQEFSTELKFTAVGVNAYEATTKRRSSNSDTDEESHETDDNWIIPPKRTKSMTFTKSPYLPPDETPTAYYHVTGEDSEDDINGDVMETPVLPVRIKRNNSDVSAQSIASNIYEIGEQEQPLTRREIILHSDEIAQSLSNELDETKPIPKNSPSLPTVEEDSIIPLKRTVTTQYRKAVNVNAAISELQRMQRISQDSAYHSDVTKSRDSDLSSQEGSIARAPKRSVGVHNTTSPLGDLKAAQVFHQKEKNECKDSKLTFWQFGSKENFIDEKFLEAFERGKESIKSRQTTSDESDDDEMEISQVKIKNDQNDKESYFLNTIEFEVIETNKQERKKEVANSATLEANKSDIAISPSQTHTEERHPHKEQKHAYRGDVTDTSSSSSSDSSEDESEIGFRATEKVDGDKPQTVHFSNIKTKPSIQSSSDEAKERRSIDEIVRDLQHAGLEATKTKFSRSSLNTTPQQTHVKLQERNNKLYSSPPEVSTGENVDWNQYGFTVDPAHYKKSPKHVRQVSLSSLVLSDNESVHSSDIPSSQTRVASPASNPIVGASLPTVAQRRSYFTTNEKSRPTEDHIPSYSSMRCDSDSDMSSLVVDKLGYEADTSSAVTTDREVTPPIVSKNAAIWEESSADEILKTPVNELCSPSDNSSSSSSSNSEIEAFPAYKKRELTINTAASATTEKMMENSNSPARSISENEITKDFQAKALPLLPNIREHPRITKNNSNSYDDLSSESNVDINSSQTISACIEKFNSTPVAKPRRTLQKYSTSKPDSNFDERAFVKGFITKKESKSTPVHHTIPIVKVIEHDIIPLDHGTTLKESPSTRCLDEVRSYTSTDIDTSSSSSDDKDSLPNKDSNQPNTSADLTSPKPRDCDVDSSQSYMSSSSSQSLLSNTSSDFDRSIPFRGSLTMRGSYVTKNPSQTHNKTYKATDAKKGERKPFVLQLW